MVYKVFNCNKLQTTLFPCAPLTLADACAINATHLKENRIFFDYAQTSSLRMPCLSEGSKVTDRISAILSLNKLFATNLKNSKGIFTPFEAPLRDLASPP